VAGAIFEPACHRLPAGVRHQVHPRPHRAHRHGRRVESVRQRPTAIETVPAKQHLRVHVEIQSRRQPAPTRCTTSSTIPHQGYCQYFAMAMGEMLRSLGIPTRLVSGYGQGGYDDPHSSPHRPGRRRPCMGRELLPELRLDPVRANQRRLLHSDFAPDVQGGRVLHRQPLLRALARASGGHEPGCALPARQRPRRQRPAHRYEPGPVRPGSTPR